MRAIIRHAAIVSFLGLAFAGCEQRPARPSPPDLSSGPQSIEISGTTTLRRVGDTSQLTVVLVYANGLKEDGLAHGARFSVPWDQSVASVTAAGLVAATGYGRTTVTVSCMRQNATIDIKVMPDGMFMLTGQITQAGQYQFPLEGVVVQTTVQGESFSAKSDYNGQYAVPAAGSTTVTVDAQNFVSQTLPVVVTGDMQLNLALQRTADAFAGKYGAVFTASPSCSLPADVQSRQYSPRVTDTNGSIVVYLGEGGFDWFGFAGTRNGNQLSFKIVSTSNYGVEWNEPMSGNWMRVDGDATGIVGPGDVVVTISGTVKVVDLLGNTKAQCTASDHKLIFSR